MGPPRLDRPGSVSINTDTGHGVSERVLRKPFFTGLIFYITIPSGTGHFSDLFYIALVIMAITGLIVRKRDNGLSGIGGWLTLAGVLIPFIYIALIVDFSSR